MKPDRITKLYEGLTNKERAALAFCCLTENNKVELDRITARVPRATYVCLDLEYRTWIETFYHLARLWAIEHWQIYARKLAEIALAQHHLKRGELAETESYLQLVEYRERQLLALDRAMEAVCQEHGFDMDSVRRIAGTAPFVPVHANTAPDAEFQADIERSFSEVLSQLRHCP